MARISKVVAGQPPSFPVNGASLDPARFNPQVIRRLTESGALLKVEDNPKEDLEELADRVEGEGQVGKEDFQTLQGLASKARKEKSRLRKEYAASGYQDPKLAAELVPFRVYETEFGKLREAHRLSSAKAAVQAVASSSFGATNVVAAYHAYAGLPKSGLKTLVQDLESEPGKVTFAGNRVEQVHHEKLWQSMNGLLDEGLQSAQQGKPVEINAQYYELTSQTMIKKLADNAAAGNKVRVNLDPGRLIPFKGETADVDDVPDKLRGMLQLMDAPGDIGVSTFPVARELGNANDLMHRKGLRVGDKFLLSGMNANSGSGENVDSGYIIEGPAARQLGVNFARDVEKSRDASLDDNYGKNAVQGFLERDVRMGRRGLMSLVDSLDGPSPPGTENPRLKTYAELEAFAKERGFELHKFIDLPKEEQGAKLDNEIASNQGLPLSDYGKRRLIDLVKLVQREGQSEKNQQALQDITPPSDAAKGTSVVSLADTPSERQAVLLKTIQDAEKFIYVPAFVITRPVAAALAAKAKDMQAAGKPIDIRVLADPGIYPDGSTPNQWGVKFLEDHNIPVRWAALPRTGGHDRKVHAKELLTDKTDFVGSTNFSNKGLRENHEQSGAVHVNPEDPLSVRQHQQARVAFEELWDNFSVSAETRPLAERWNRNKPGPDHEYRVEDARHGVIKRQIRAIHDYEVESGNWVGQQVADLKLEGRVQELMAQGFDDGNAKLKAVREKMGPEAFLQGLHGLPSYPQG